MWAFPVLAAPCWLPRVLLRRWPLMALVVMLGGSVAAMALKPIDAGEHPADRHRRRRGHRDLLPSGNTHPQSSRSPAWPWPALGLLILLLEVPSRVCPGRHRSGPAAPVAVAVPLVTIIAWLIGHSIRQAQARAELLRAQAAAQTALAERLRIARELHDIVAHSIGIIAIQAGSGRRVFDAQSRRGARRPGRHRSHQPGDAGRAAADGDRAAARRPGPGPGRRRWTRRPA